MAPNKKRRVRKRTNGLCGYCGLTANSVDHILAQSKGGADDDSNLIASCFSCNKIKDSLTLEEFRIKVFNHINGLIKKFGLKDVNIAPEDIKFYFEIHGFQEIPIPTPQKKKPWLWKKLWKAYKRWKRKQKNDLTDRPDSATVL